MHKIAFTAVAFAVGTMSSVAGGNLLLGTKPASVFTSKSTVQAQKVSSTKPKTVTKKEAPATPPAPAPVMVSVQSGDTLSSIADTHATTYVRIYNANEAVQDPNVINPGQQLRIPDSNEQLPDRGLVTTALAPAATTVAVRTTQASAVSYPAVSGNDAKAFIYSRESGNNPNATNPNGCYGLGQDCNGRVRALCGADYACQDEFFTNYAMSRYGSWEGAVAFWQTHGWW